MAHSAMCLNSTVDNDDIDQWKNARVVVLDEVSFLNMHDLNHISTNLSKLMEVPITKHCGGLHMVFCGDFCQLHPPRSDPLYKHRECVAWFGDMNSFIELKGMHQFKDDKLWGELLMRFQKWMSHQRRLSSHQFKSGFWWWSVATKHSACSLWKQGQVCNQWCSFFGSFGADSQQEQGRSNPKTHSSDYGG